MLIPVERAFLIILFVYGSVAERSLFPLYGTHAASGRCGSRAGDDNFRPVGRILFPAIHSCPSLI